MIIENIADNDLRSIKISNEIILEKKLIGQFVKNKSSITVLNVNHIYDHLLNKEIKISNFGKWHIYEITGNEGEDTCTLNLEDMSYKFDDEYVDDFAFPNTLGAWANYVGSKVGIPLKGSFLNYDLVITEKPYFEENASYRDIVALIAKYACGWAEVNVDNTYSIKWFENVLYKIEDWENFKSGKTIDPINIIILSTGVTEDNVKWPDEAPNFPHELRIEDDWIGIDRYKINESIFNQVNGLTYTVITQLIIPYGLLNLKAGQKISVEDSNHNVIETYISSHVLTWDGGNFYDPNSWTSEIKMNEVNETTTNYKNASSIKNRMHKAEIATKKNEAAINMLTEEIGDIELETNPVKHASGNPIEIIDAGEYPLERLVIKGASEQKTSTPKSTDNMFDFNVYIKNKDTYVGTNSSTNLTENSIKVMPGLTESFTPTPPYNASTQTEKNIALFKKLRIEVDENTEYTMSYDNPNQVMTQCLVFWFDKNFNILSYPASGPNANNRHVFKSTSPANAKYVCFRWDNEAKDGTSVLEITNIAFKKGTDSTYSEFAPVMPSPEYPSEIKSVKGIDNNFDYGTLDEYFFSDANGTIIHPNDKNIARFVDIDLSKNKISFNNYKSTGYPWVSKFIRLKKNTTYYVKSLGTGDGKIVGFNSIDDGAVGTSLTSLTANNRNPIFNSGNYNYYIASFYPSSVVKPTEIENLIISEKNASIYVPYGTWLPVKITGKNFLNNILKSQTINGLIVTVNKDKSVLINGTATKNTNFIIANGFDFTGELILSGCPKGGSTSTYGLQYSNYVDKAFVDKGDGVTITHFDKDKYPNAKFDMYIREGYTANNLLFKPMVRPISIEDDSYETYKKTTSLIDMNKPNLFGGVFRQGSESDTKASIKLFSANNIYLEPGTYTIKTNISDIYRYAVLISNLAYPCTHTPNVTYDSTWQNDNFIFTITKGGYFGIVIDKRNENITLDEISNFYFELYEGSNSNYEFGSVSEVKDVFDNGNFEENIASYVFTGEENIGLHDETGLRRFALQGTGQTFPLPKAQFESGGRFFGDCLSSHFPTSHENYASQNDLTVYAQRSLSEGYLVITDFNNKWSSVEEFKTWLKEQYDNKTPLVIKYVIEPQHYTLPFEKVNLFKGYNLISIEDGKLGELEVDYLTDSILNAQYVSRGEFNLTAEEIRSQLSRTVTDEKLNATIEESENKIIQKLDDAEASITQEVSKTFSESIDNLQKQIDGAIQFFKGDEIPTLTNYPASDWKTDDDKNNHLGDIYYLYGVENGKTVALNGYRFDKVDGKYQWILLSDTELAAIQSLAETAKKTADDVKNNLEKNYSNTTQMNAAITEKVDKATAEINLEVSKKANEADVDAALKLKVGTNDNDKIVSMLLASAMEIALKSNRFSMESDFSKIKNNGEVEFTGGTIGSLIIDDNSLSIPIYAPFNVTQADVDKMYKYVIGSGTLTNDEIKKYDFNKNGKVDIGDCGYGQRILRLGLSATVPSYIKIVSDGIFSGIFFVNSSGTTVWSLDLDGFYDNIDNVSLDSLFYYAGEDVLFNNRLECVGHLTGGSKGIQFTFPTPKLLTNISKITITSFDITVRHVNGGYLLEHATSINGTIAVRKVTDNQIGVDITLNTAFSNVPNNTPVAVTINEMYIIFS